MRERPFNPAVAAQILRRQTRSLPGTVGVYVTDLASGQTASVNPSATFYGASTLKVPIAMTVLWLVGQGRLSLDQRITYLPQDFQAGAGVLQATIRPGDRITIRRLVDLMITVSDNIARNMLERYIGSGTVRRYMTSIGVTPPYDPVARTVTPYGMNQALIALDTGRSGLLPEHTRLLLGFMENTVHRTRIPAKLPSDVTVANKIGTWPGQVHDFALVYEPDRSFAISVFTRGIAEAQAEDAIANIAAAIYWYMDSLVAR
ncbi:MAG: putative beta-lactamase [Symbiobacteriaceae bacterium]|jgi:beta-lactamase class A|nr:putative beta-lactamase [Symbiobacteriaceae bacterium]